MVFVKMIKNMSNHMQWYDISFLKMSVFFFTLFLITVLAGFRNLVLDFQWYWYLIIAVLFMIPLLKKIFPN